MQSPAFLELIADTIGYTYSRIHTLICDDAQRRRLTNHELRSLAQYDSAMQRLLTSKSTSECLSALQVVNDTFFGLLRNYTTVSEKHPEVDDSLPHDPRTPDVQCVEFTCPTCMRRLSSRRRLKEHLLIHRPYESRRYLCTKCPKRYLSSSDLAKHREACCRIVKRAGLY